VPGLSHTDWPAKVADTVQDAVETVQDRVVRPLTLGARGLVFGILIAVMALVVAIVMCIALVRVLTVYVFDGRVWASDALLGAILVLAGVFVWSRRGASRAQEG
jgi:hypothetical protein